MKWKKLSLLIKICPSGVLGFAIRHYCICLIKPKFLNKIIVHIDFWDLQEMIKGNKLSVITKLCSLWVPVVSWKRQRLQAWTQVSGSGPHGPLVISSGPSICEDSKPAATLCVFMWVRVRRSVDHVDVHTMFSILCA